MSSEDTRASENGITVFSWNEFPVERDRFFVCICTENLEEFKSKSSITAPTTPASHLDPLNTSTLNFIKSVFPEECKTYTERNDIVEYKKRINKSTLLFDFNKKSDWIDCMVVLQGYLNSGHFIFVGPYENIPKTALTVSDILIFDTANTANKYLSERHNSNINNFNTNTHYILIDRRRMGFSVHGLTKSDLERYS